jgi:hypothetical protein
MTDGSITVLRKYAHDFAHQQTMDNYNYNDDEDHNLAIGHLVVT